MKYEEITSIYLKEIYKVCLYLMKDEASAYQITKQTFQEFYPHYKKVKKELIFAELVKIARRLAEAQKTTMEKEVHECENEKNN